MLRRVAVLASVGNARLHRDVRCEARLRPAFASGSWAGPRRRDRGHQCSTSRPTLQSTTNMRIETHRMSMLLPRICGGWLEISG